MLITEELKQFADIVRESYKKVLPTERLAVEEHLFLANVEYAHLASLLWERNTKTVTDSYKLYLLEICLEHLFTALILSDNDVNEAIAAFDENIKYFYSVVEEKNYSYTLIVSLIATEYGASQQQPDTLNKLAYALAILLKQQNITMLQFLDHYKTWKLK